MFSLHFSSKVLSRALVSAGALILLAASGCQNYKDQLQRGQGYYEQNQYEHALAVWRNLEDDQDSLSPPEVVRYCYLRGMTDFRLGFTQDARYWLGLASAGLKRAQAEGGGKAAALQPDETARLEETLAELNKVVYGIAPAADTSAQALGDSCKWTSDCESGFACQEGTCIQAEQPDAPAETAPAPAPSAVPAAQ